MTPGFPPSLLPFFAGFTAFTPEVPKLYWDVKSQEQRYFTLCKDLHKLICYANTIAATLNINTEELEALQADFDKFIESGFNDYYEDQVEQWIGNNLDYVFNIIAKQVYFGINEQGYFVAYIPNGWDDIIFDTGMNYELDTYGRLILRWNVDSSPYTVNQTPEMKEEENVNS